MAGEQKPRGERFTMLEARGPNNPSPEELASRVVDLAFNERFTMLESRGPNNPSPEELASRVVEPIINGGPVIPGAAREVPQSVLSLVAQLASAIGALDDRGRSAALDYVSAELGRRVAG